MSPSDDADGEEAYIRIREIHASELLGAVTTFVNYRGSQDPEKLEEWQEAREWLFSDEEGAGSFLEACEELGFHVSKIRLLVVNLEPRQLVSVKVKEVLFDG